MTIELPHKVKQWNNFCGEKCVSLWLCTSNVFGQSAFDTTEDELGIPEHSLGGLSWNRKYHFKKTNVPIKVAINGTIPYVEARPHTSEAKVSHKVWNGGPWTGFLSKKTASLELSKPSLDSKLVSQVLAYHWYMKSDMSQMFDGYPFITPIFTHQPVLIHRTVSRLMPLWVVCIYINSMDCGWGDISLIYDPYNILQLRQQYKWSWRSESQNLGI